MDLAHSIECLKNYNESFGRRIWGCSEERARGLSPPRKIMTVLRNEIVNLMKQKGRTDGHGMDRRTEGKGGQWEIWQGFPKLIGRITWKNWKRKQLNLKRQHMVQCNPHVSTTILTICRISRLLCLFQTRIPFQFTRKVTNKQFDIQIWIQYDFIHNVPVLV